MFQNIKNAILISLVMFVLCGLAYPLAMTGIAQTVFPEQAGGSLIKADGKIVGSKIIGQNFQKKYFMHCRPSAVNYNTYTKEAKENGEFGGVSSGSNNYAPSNPALMKRVQGDLNKFLQENPTAAGKEIPADMLTASGSGLDPHISVMSAQLQVDRIAAHSNLTPQKINEIIAQNTNKKLFGIFGEETVNVLGVNLSIAKEMGLIQNYQ